LIPPRPIQLPCTTAGAMPRTGQLIGTDRAAVWIHPVMSVSAELGTGGIHGCAGHPPMLPAHHRNSRLGSLRAVKVPLSGPAGLNAKESGPISVAVNIWPGGVLRLRCSEWSKAKRTPEGKRLGVTGLCGHLTLHFIPQHEMAVKLAGAPTLPGGLGVAPHIILASSTMSAPIATPVDAIRVIAYCTAYFPYGQFRVHHASPPMLRATSSPVPKIWKPWSRAKSQSGAAELYSDRIQAR